MPSIVGESRIENERPQIIPAAHQQPVAPKSHGCLAVLRQSSAYLKASLALLLFGFSCGCQSKQQPSNEKRTLTVAVAPSLRPALNALLTSFQTQHPDVNVQFVEGASGTLASQAIAGAPFDLLLAADDVAPQQLIEIGIAQPDSYFNFAHGRLVLWVNRDWQSNLEREGIQFLRSDRWRRIAWADPRVAPYGRAAEEILEREGVAETVQPRALIGGSVSQVANWLESQAADIGFLPLSLALQDPLHSQGTFIEISDRLSHPLAHAGVMLRRTKQPDLARSWIEHLRSQPSQAILQNHGYLPPP